MTPCTNPCKLIRMSQQSAEHVVLFLSDQPHILSFLLSLTSLPPACPRPGWTTPRGRLLPGRDIRLTAPLLSLLQGPRSTGRRPLSPTDQVSPFLALVLTSTTGWASPAHRLGPHLEPGELNLFKGAEHHCSQLLMTFLERRIIINNNYMN